MVTNGSSQHQGIDTIALPILEDYDVSRVTGFVPYPQPLDALPLPYYEPWEDIMKQLNQLMDSRQLRSRVDQVNQLR
jgi:indoleamine 2,3-dioxygenase